MSRYSLEDFCTHTRYQSQPLLTAGGREVLFICDAGGSPGLWRQPADGGAAYEDPHWTGVLVRQIAYAKKTDTLVLLADREGKGRSELSYQIGKQAPISLTSDSPAPYHLGKSPISPDGRYLIFTSYAGAAGTRVELFDLEAGVRCVVLEGAYYSAINWSPDGRYVVVVEFHSNVDQSLWLLDPHGGERTLLNPHEGEQVYVVGAWTPAEQSLLGITSGDREFRGIVRMQPNRAPTWLLETDCDVETLLALGSDQFFCVTNESGFSRFSLLGLSGEKLAFIPQPEHYGVLVGYLDEANERVACCWSAPTVPERIGILRPGEKAAPAGSDSAAAEPAWHWLPPVLTPAVPAEQLLTPELVSVPGVDGPIPGWLYWPQGASPKRRAPVLMFIHGGPEEQERPTYNPLYQYLLHLGIGVFTPNIRGSRGYGRSYQLRIYGQWGTGDLLDVEACARYLKTVPWVNPDRLAISGSSYGGFVALSAAARLPHLWSAVVDLFGPVNLVTFVNEAPAAWRSALTYMIGDPETEADKLLARSPIAYVDQVRAPLLVIQGAKDRRVPASESEQLVNALRERRVPVEYVLFPDEGHSFEQRSNRLKAWQQIADFLVRHLRP